MGKNDLLNRIARVQENAMDMGVRLMQQFMEDTLEVTLHRKGYGYKRVMDILDLWEEVRKEYKIAMYPSNAEADVAQEHMDAEIQAICKDEMTIDPFPKRYPELKKITYEGRKR